MYALTKNCCNNLGLCHNIIIEGKEGGKKCETKKNQKRKKKDKLKNNFKLFRKNRINEYYSLVNLETSNPDFLRNSIADFSVNSCCFTDGCGFLNVS